MTEKKGVVEFKGQAYEVESQAVPITDEAIADARNRIGFDYRAVRDTFEITYDWIKCFCNYIGSDNPLFLDSEYARKSRWGSIIAPPMMSLHRDAIAPGLRGIQWLWGGYDMECYRPVRLGEVLTQRGRLISVDEKSGRMCKRMILQKGELVYYDQRGEKVAKGYIYMMRAPRAKSGAGFRYEPRLQKYSDDDLTRIEAQIEAYQIRGAIPRYWEDVNIGEEIGPAVYGPYRAVDIAFTQPTENERSDGAHVYQLLHRRKHAADSYVDPETGVQDHPHRGHWEDFMAEEVGMPGAYDWAMQRVQAMSSRLVFDWMGDDGFLKKAGGRTRRPVVVGDTLFLRGKVAKKYIQDGDHIVEIDAWEENQIGTVVMDGNATVALPSRA